MTRSRLLVLRDRIDEIAAQWPKVSFVSFGDTLLLKTHWWPGNFELTQQYQTEPETIIDIYAQIDRAYRDALELGTYAVLVQGVNVHYRDPPLAHLAIK